MAHHLVAPRPTSNGNRVGRAPFESQNLVEFGTAPFEEPFLGLGLGFDCRPWAAAYQNAMQVVLDDERMDKTIKMVTCLNPEGKTVARLGDSNFAGERGDTVMIGMPRITHVNARVVYYEDSGAITLPLRLETGLGLGPPLLCLASPGGRGWPVATGTTRSDARADIGVSVGSQRTELPR
jgi:hypothetical protein